MSSGNLTILFNDNGTPFTSTQSGQSGKTIFQLEETVVQKLNNFKNNLILENCFHQSFGARKITKS
jgi:hypothetical protein